MNPTRVLTALIAALLLTTVAWAADVRDFYKVGDKCWGPAIQRAIDSLADTDDRWPDRSGGTVHFPKGHYPVTTPITIDIPVTIKGETAAPYACSIEWKGTDPEDPEVEEKVEEEDADATDDEKKKKKKRRALFTFHRHDWDANVRFEHIEIRSNKSGVAIRFDSTDKFQYTRGYGLYDVTIVGFATAIEVTGGGKQRWWGNLTCTDCTIHYCGAVVDATAGQLNETRFYGCTMTKLGLASEGWKPQYAFRFRGGDNIGFYGCNLEATPRVLDVDRVRGFEIVNNCRFEGNATTDDPVVHIRNTNDVRVKVSHRVLKIEERKGAPPTILLENCRNYNVEPMAGRVHIHNDYDSPW